MRSIIPFLGTVLFLITAACSNPEISKIGLSGEWRFAVDSTDTGVTDQWYAGVLNEVVTLPGSMTTNGKGDDITLKTPWTGQIVDSSYYKKDEYIKFREPDNIKIPFWLQPIKYYKGAAWYQKEVTIPENWNGQFVGLFLERCHWESRLWVDNQEMGMQNSLGTPHQYDLTHVLTPGKHRLTLCIDNRVKDIDPGVNSHSITDHTQSNWNGMVGQLYLEARPLVHIQNIQVYPDVQNQKIAVKVMIQNSGEKEITALLDLAVAGTDCMMTQYVELENGENLVEVDFPMADEVKQWNEFHPNVYTLEASLKNNTSGQTDHHTTTFGMREFKAVGKQLHINGQPIFLRGTLECAIFPKTGYPSTDLEEWLRIFNVCRAHGLNHMRFHSWCPPKAAFDAADQTGIYLQVEVSSWANQSTTLGDGKSFDKYLYEESERMVEAFGNHPSFCMMVYGNEPGGANQVPFLTEFVNFWKNKDSRRIYTSGAGWPNLPVNDFLSDPAPRIQGWGQELKSVINGEAPKTDYDWSVYNAKFPQPIVSHEIGQWCVYPNFKEMSKYTGVLKPKNFEIFKETLEENGLGDLAEKYLLASGKLQTLCYKADIEAALRTKSLGGFQLLDLHDFPGQGTALIGVLDAFWDEKGYVTPEQFRAFNNETVPLARLKRRVFKNTDTLKVAVEVAHFGKEEFKGVIPKWSLIRTDDSVFAEGDFMKKDIPIGNGISLGNIDLPLSKVEKAEKLTLKVTIENFENSWDIWVYPNELKPISKEDGFKVVSKLDDTTIKYLQNGGNVLLNVTKGDIAPDKGGDIGIGFSSIFWNTSWTNGQKPHTLGILCDPEHPAFANFPTEFHSNWQWWDAMSHSNAIVLDGLPDLDPIVRVIDDWFKNRRTALIFEAKVGKGKLLMSGIDLHTNLEGRLEAKQLLYSLKNYMASDGFSPQTSLDIDQIKSLLNYK